MLAYPDDSNKLTKQNIGSKSIRAVFEPNETLFVGFGPCLNIGDSSQEARVGAVEIAYNCCSPGIVCTYVFPGRDISCF